MKRLVFWLGGVAWLLALGIVNGTEFGDIPLIPGLGIALTLMVAGTAGIIKGGIEG